MHFPTASASRLTLPKSSFLRMLDPENLEGQIREEIIGLTMNWKLIYVVYTMRKGDIFRIISARSVTKYERRLYEEQ